MPAVFRRHLVGKTLRNLCYCDAAQKATKYDAVGALIGLCDSVMASLAATMPPHVHYTVSQ